MMGRTTEQLAVGEKVPNHLGGMATVTAINGDIVTTSTGLDWGWDGEQLIESISNNGQRKANSPVSDLKRLGQQLHRWGANVTAIKRGTKKTIHDWGEWQVRRQTAAEFEALPWDSAGGVGVVNGSGGWRCLDIDAVDKEKPDGPKIPKEYAIAFLQALGLPDDYAWCYRSGSGRGWHIWIRCNDGNQ